MPISLIPIKHNGCWSGSTWVVDDKDELAEKIEFVALGQLRSVERILHAMDAAPEGQPTGGFAGARGLLTVEDGAEPYHRDGWVFQVISWIASHCKDDEALIRVSQMIKADKVSRSLWRMGIFITISRKCEGPRDCSTDSVAIVL